MCLCSAGQHRTKKPARKRKVRGEESTPSEFQQKRLGKSCRGRSRDVTGLGRRPWNYRNIRADSTYSLQTARLLLARRSFFPRTIPCLHPYPSSSLIAIVQKLPRASRTGCGGGTSEGGRFSDVTRARLDARRAKQPWAGLRGGLVRRLRDHLRRSGKWRSRRRKWPARAPRNAWRSHREAALSQSLSCVGELRAENRQTQGVAQAGVRPLS